MRKAKRKIVARRSRFGSDSIAAAPATCGSQGERGLIFGMSYRDFGLGLLSENYASVMHAETRLLLRVYSKTVRYNNYCRSVNSTINLNTEK